MSGHYYLIVLNLKAGRFEVMDSMRKEGDKLLMQDARNIIGSIKHFWQANYSASKIDISKYMTVHIPTPMQKTTLVQTLDFCHSIYQFHCHFNSFCILGKSFDELFVLLVPSYDCGYFVLKFIESWDGRRLLPFSPYDMPALRKLYLKRWMATERNLINWDELLFPN
jgi:Ulp1 family protease